MLEGRMDNILAELVNTFKRFPVVVTLGVATCIMQMIINRRELEIVDPYKYMTTLALGCCIFLALRLFVDGKRLPRFLYYSIAIPIFCLVIWYINFGHATVSSMVMMGAGFMLAIFTAPFFGSEHSSLKLWTFNYRIYKALRLAVIMTIVLFTGIFTISTAITILFNIKIYQQFHLDVMTITTGFISPMIVLSSMAKSIPDTFVYPKAVRGSLTYAILPLLYIFGAVLACYGVKILLNTSMVQNHSVSTLYLSLACYAMFAYLLSYPVRDEPNSVGFYARNFFIMLLLPVVFIAIDVFYEITHDGLTKTTYLKLLLLIWFSISILFSFFCKTDGVPRFIIASLAVLYLASSFGPWGIVNVPTDQIVKPSPADIKNREIKNG